MIKIQFPTLPSGDTLLVGTRQGQLLVYTVQPAGGLEPKFNVFLLRPNKAFSKKAITQLAVIPEYHILISLSGTQINIGFLQRFQDEKNTGGRCNNSRIGATWDNPKLGHLYWLLNWLTAIMTNNEAIVRRSEVLYDNVYEGQQTWVSYC